MKRKACNNQVEKNTQTLKSLMDNQFNADTAIDLIRNKADPEIKNSNGKSVDDLIVEFYLNKTKFIDSKQLKKTSFLYNCEPVTINVGTLKGSYVVMKEITPKQDASRIEKLEVLINFCKETYFLQQLTEAEAPNVVKYLNFSVNKLSNQIIMEYTSNGSLGSCIENDASKPFNWEYRLQIIKGIIRGLKCIHLFNIIHCDLKSDNIFIDKDYQAKIGDFGSAQIKNEKVNKALTSTCYRAPEVFQFDYSEKSDIFGLGLTIWEACAWDKIWFKIMDIIEEEQEMYDYYQSGKRFEIPSDTSPKLSNLIKWCWETEAKKRPFSAELPDELNNEIEFKPNQI
ncbi:MAG: protein kinase [Tatlockia sp.]|nr:protein kinase [Tatlockia sp.]